MSLTGKSLAVMAPMYGGMCMNNFFNAAISLKELLLKKEVQHSFLSVSNESLVTRARNKLVDLYLKNTEHTHAVFIDADIGFDPHDILRLLDLDIVGAPCSQKTIRWDRVQKAIAKGRRYQPEELSLIGGQFVFNPEHFNGKREMQIGEPNEMKHIGTGIMMVRRNVFERFEEEYPDRWYESRGSDPADLPGPIHEFFKSAVNAETRYYDSEDYWFCNDCKAMGFKVWICPWMVTTHMGTYAFTANIPACTALTGEI